MTVRTNVRALRHALEQNPDGLTLPEVSAMTGIDTSSLNHAVKWIDHAYVDRWVPSRDRKHWVVVYCLWERPPVPPKPAMNPREYEEGVVA